MTNPSHIIQLIDFAAQECMVMAECGRHVELAASRRDIEANIRRLQGALRRASENVVRELVKDAVTAASESFGIDETDIPYRNNFDAGSRAREAVILAVDTTETGMRTAISNRIGMGVESIRAVRQRAGDRIHTDSDFRARYEQMVQSLYSGDGASVQVAA